MTLLEQTQGDLCTLLGHPSCHHHRCRGVVLQAFGLFILRKLNNTKQTTLGSCRSHVGAGVSTVSDSKEHAVRGISLRIAHISVFLFNSSHDTRAALPALRTNDAVGTYRGGKTRSTSSLFTGSVQRLWLQDYCQCLNAGCVQSWPLSSHCRRIPLDIFQLHHTGARNYQCHSFFPLSCLMYVYISQNLFDDGFQMPFLYVKYWTVCFTP